MPQPHSRTRAFIPALLGACLLTLSLASGAAGAKSNPVPGDMRVVDADGSTLAQQTQFAGGAVKVRSDRKADCFGDGTGGSGDRVTIPGKTALAQLADAATTNRDLRPLSLTDAFDFGLGLCGIGRAEAPSTGFWYLKVNHAASQVGADQTKVKRGDELLWFLIEDFSDPTPSELELLAPDTARAGGELTARVFSYADGGKRSPAAGVAVEGADEPTDAQGRVAIDADEPMLELQATGSAAIPSNVVYVCTQGPDECPAGYAETIGGTKGEDRIKLDRVATTVLAGGGDDRINAMRGRYGDVFKCGAGEDRVRVSKQIAKRSEFKGCERVDAVR